MSASVAAILSLLCALEPVDQPLQARPQGTSAPPGASEVPRWGLELRSGPFQPRISTEDRQREFFELLFVGQNDALFEDQPLLTAVEYDWYFWRDYGLLGLTVAAGYWAIEGRARNCGELGCTPESVVEQSTVGSTPVRLTLLPLGLGLVYRMDLLKRYYGIPLTVYGKAGLNAFLWWANAGGEPSETAERAGQGYSFGLDVGGGVALNLDFIEPRTSAEAARSFGMVDTYLFFEAKQLIGNNFGDSGRLDMTDTWFQLGLAIDFR